MNQPDDHDQAMREHHHRAVELAESEQLIDALEGKLACPQCLNTVTDVGLSAGGNIWECLTCQYQGTRYLLERLVLEDAGALDEIAGPLCVRCDRCGGDASVGWTLPGGTFCDSCQP